MAEITVRVTIPAILTAQLQAPLGNVLSAAGKDIARNLRLDFQATARTWRRKPNFVTLSSLIPDGVQVSGGTDDRIWNLLEQGVPHSWKIPKAGGGTLLAFRSGYAAKTAPNWLGSRAGGAYGALVVTRKQVTHPPLPARNWIPELAGKWIDKAPLTVNAYLAAWNKT